MWPVGCWVQVSVVCPETRHPKPEALVLAILSLLRSRLTSCFCLGARLASCGPDCDGVSVDKNFHAPVFGASVGCSIVSHRLVLTEGNNGQASRIDFLLRREITRHIVRP